MPLHVLAIGLFLGLAAGAALPEMPLAGMASILGAGTALTLAYARSVPPKPRRALIWVALSGLALGASLAPASPAPIARRATVTAEAERVDGLGTVLSADDGARIRLPDVRIEPGAVTALEGTFSPRPGFRNPSPHAAWPDLGGTTFIVEDLSRAEVISPPSAYRRMITAAQDRVRRSLALTLHAEALGVARALVLGESEGLDPEVTTSVRAAGLTHVLAVSGMHVSLVVGVLVWALQRALVRIRPLASRLDVRRIASAVGVPLAVIYADFAGGTPSGWRAAITAALALGLTSLGRRPGSLATCAGAAVILAALDPGAALSPGFILSIAATAAILAPPRATQDASELRQALRVSARAWIATLPFTLYVFGGLPWITVVANLVVVPIASALLLPAALIHAAVAAVSLECAALTAPVLEGLSSTFVGASEAFAAILPGTSFPPPDVAEGLVLVLVALVLLARLDGRRKAACLLALALCYAGLEARLRFVEQPRGALRVTFLDVGQGDAALLDMPDGSLWVIDAGGAPGGGPDPGERVVVPLLRARRRSRIDRMIITHPHPDHYGGLARIAESMAIDEIWDTGQGEVENPEGELQAVLSGLASRGTHLWRPASLCGPPRRLSGVLVEVLWPCPSFDVGHDPNDNSFVIRIRFGRRTFLFAGDAEAHAEAALAGRIGHVDVLKVGHHGSRTSSGEAFLRELDPRIAIVSAGAGNRFGHPHTEVVDRFAARTTALFRTDLEGGITVTTDGSRLWADAFSGRHLGVRDSLP